MYEESPSRRKLGTPLLNLTRPDWNRRGLLSVATTKYPFTIGAVFHVKRTQATQEHMQTFIIQMNDGQTSDSALPFRNDDVREV